ncbi:hypothetical protein E2C01_075983 [Portunus trituberculatus]|uniref:Uncharacterized protein n=1 Tax=Portunus trituberculatus TaxID=210409 RepID=A0A5B7I7J7_PORTR|nr:hypothetical protein [Portunus trituberculatus]
MQKGARGRGCAGGELGRREAEESTQRKGREAGKQGGTFARVSPSFFPQLAVALPLTSCPRTAPREGRKHLLPRHRLKVPIDGRAPIQRRVFRVAGRAGLRLTRGQDRPLTGRVTARRPRASWVSLLRSSVLKNNYESR